MSYITSYELILETSIPDFQIVLEKETDEPWEGEGTSYYLISKWYDNEIDMCRISKKYPNILFTLYGDGEESDDLWVKYWLNGKYQFSGAHITYDQFNKNKLRNFTFNE